MRKISPAIACLFALSISMPAYAQSASGLRGLSGEKGHKAFTIQRASVRTGCFDAQLKAILRHIAKKTGRTPIVTSGYRPHAHRRHSEHRTCDAADIRVPGTSDKAIVAAARTAPGIGGIGRYCNGIIHVDTGDRRQWVDC